MSIWLEMHPVFRLRVGSIAAPAFRLFRDPRTFPYTDIGVGVLLSPSGKRSAGQQVESATSPRRRSTPAELFVKDGGLADRTTVYPLSEGSPVPTHQGSTQRQGSHAAFCRAIHQKVSGRLWLHLDPHDVLEACSRCGPEPLAFSAMSSEFDNPILFRLATEKVIRHGEGDKVGAAAVPR